MSSSYLGQQSDGSLNSSSTGYCVPSSAISIEFSPFSVLLITLIVADLVALMIMIGCVWRETVERQAYKLAKGKPVKLMLTQVSRLIFG